MESLLHTSKPATPSIEGFMLRCGRPGHPEPIGFPDLGPLSVQGKGTLWPQVYSIRRTMRYLIALADTKETVEATEEEGPEMNGYKVA